MIGLRIAIVLGLLAVVSACGGGRERDITLHDMRTNQRSPEEFSILPAKPLSEPESYTALPAPTPGGVNRTDQTPNADAVAVLGGNPARLTTGSGGSDATLLSYAGRYGTDPNIRADLAAKDLELRKRGSRFTWSIVPRDDYRRAYRRYILNPYTELARFRKMGVPTPSAPPASD